jgi:hypothetical protein
MEEHNLNNLGRHPSLTSLIAWLSVCLLAAAWVHTLDERSQALWRQAGAFGLAAAVGLGALEKVRLASDRRVRLRATRIRVESGLNRLNEHSATLDSINAAIRRLTEYAVQQRQGPTATPGRSKRFQDLLLKDYPLEVVPIEEAGFKIRCERAQPISGTLRQISSNNVSFEHIEPFTPRVVLLNFSLSGQAQLSFVVDVIWTQKSREGFASGGTLIAVGVPAQEDVRSVLRPDAVAT